MTDKPKTLYELTKAEQEIQAEIDGLLEPEPDPETGAFPDMDAHLAKLIKFQLASEDKVERMMHVAESYEHTAAVAKADYESKRDIIKRSLEASKAADGKARRLRERIKQHMEDTGKSELMTRSGRTFKVCKNGGSPTVVVPPEAKLSMWDESLFKVELKADKPALVLWEKNGGTLPDGVFTFRGTHLKIK